MVSKHFVFSAVSKVVEDEFLNDSMRLIQFSGTKKSGGHGCFKALSAKASDTSIIIYKTNKIVYCKPQAADSGVGL